MSESLAMRSLSEMHQAKMPRSGRRRLIGRVMQSGSTILLMTIICCCLTVGVAASPSFVAGSDVAGGQMTLSLTRKMPDFTLGASSASSRVKRSSNWDKASEQQRRRQQEEERNKSDLAKLLDMVQYGRPACPPAAPGPDQSGSSAASISPSQFNLTEPVGTLANLFRTQMLTALHVANTLNNFFHVRGGDTAMTADDEAVFYSLVRSIVTNDALLLGYGILFEPSVRHKTAAAQAAHSPSASSLPSSSGSTSTRQTKGGAFSFAPWADRMSGGSVHVKDLAQSLTTRYPTRLIYNQFDAVRHNTDYQSTMWIHKDCGSPSHGRQDVKTRINDTSISTSEHFVRWLGPFYNCSFASSWIVTMLVPFFACDKAEEPPISFKGAVAVYINLDNLDINQCGPSNTGTSNSETSFAGTHRCPPSTSCRFTPGHGFKRGGYECACGQYGQLTSGVASYSGFTVEQAYARQQQGNKSSPVYSDLRCPCPVGCAGCLDDVTSKCLVERDVTMRLVPLVVQIVCMVACTALAVLVLRLRRVKVMKAAVWPLLEVILVGALLLYSSVVVQYFEPATITCSVGNWAREVGFVFFYGALVIKLYKVLAEFQSRKARRVIIRDWELLRYMSGLAVIAIAYMGAWLAVNVDYVSDGGSMVDYGQTSDGLIYPACRLRWWSCAVQAGEFVFLCFSIYICHRVRSAPTDYRETRYISWAIYNETLVSTVVHVASHFLWLKLHPDFIFIVYFLRCQMTVTVNLMLIFAPKLWYVSHPPRSDTRGRPSSAAISSDTHDNALPAETVKLRMTNPNGDVDISEVNISEMDTEDIRSELKRVYTQLHVYRTKTMHKDNPHISKKRGGKRNQAPRRFSLQAFHHRHKRDHAHGGSSHGHSACGEPSYSEANDATEVSRTPEESTNSAEGLGYSIAEEASSYGIPERSDGPSTTRTPTVTFKPGHTSMS